MSEELLMTSKLLFGIVTILMVTPVFAQTSGGPRPAFEVASIKLHVDRGLDGVAGFQNLPGSPRLDAMNVTFKMLMQYAYGGPRLPDRRRTSVRVSTGMRELRPVEVLIIDAVQKPSAN
jgi:hypothetical protein